MTDFANPTWLDIRRSPDIAPYGGMAGFANPQCTWLDIRRYPDIAPSREGGDFNRVHTILFGELLCKLGVAGKGQQASEVAGP